MNNEIDENCSSCLKFNSNNHPDFEIISPDENGSIKIEKIRLMQEDVAKKPITSNRKVYIIEDSDCMTKEAQNCLLKTLEEPPEYIVIILTTANESMLLNTVKSRCMKIYFEQLKDIQIKEYLNKNNYENVNDGIIKQCGGSIGKALKIYDNKEIYEAISKILSNMRNNSLSQIINEADIIYKQKENIFDILNYINIYLYNSNNIQCIQFVEDTKRRLKQNANYDMTMDYLFIRIWEEINEKHSRGTV